MRAPTTDSPDLRELRGQARECAADLRGRALAVDTAPQDLTGHLDCPGFAGIRRLQGAATSQLAATAALVELARGDAGAVLACPGAALAGVLTRVLGSPEQNDRLAAAVADGRSWAYLAITEPAGGSSPARPRTELRPDSAGGYTLHGVKRYIGNGSRGTVGVVLARTGPGPLSVRAALVDSAGPGVRATALDMVGLRGAGISELAFDGLPVPAENLLGGHLSPLRRGMWGVLRGFHIVRVHVAAMAVGTALAVHDYVRAQRPNWPATPASELDCARGEIEAATRLVYEAAAAVDADPDRGHASAMAKLAAVDLARRVCARLPALLGPGALLDHPLLEKWWRDSAAFEFMEGTSDIQRLQVAAGRLRTGATGAR